MKKNKLIPVLMTTALFAACLSLCGCEQRAGSTNSGSLDNQIDIGDIVVRR